MGVADEPKKKNPIGVTGTTVADNVKRLREEQRLAFTELAREPGGDWEADSHAGLRHIEAYKRRVDSDDLMALAVALGVSPITLLLPNSYDRSDLVTVTGVPEPCSAKQVWEWMRADGPLSAPDSGIDLIDFIGRATPVWRARQYAEGVLKLVELTRIEEAMKSEDQQVAAEARRRFEEMRTRYDGND